jgi:hypothetical protein
LGANVVEGAAYLPALTDSDGRLFDSGSRYVMHFTKKQLALVRGFWSRTIYSDR